MTLNILPSDIIKELFTHHLWGSQALHFALSCKTYRDIFITLDLKSKYTRLVESRYQISSDYYVCDAMTLPSGKYNGKVITHSLSKNTTTIHYCKDGLRVGPFIVRSDVWSAPGDSKNKLIELAFYVRGVRMLDCVRGTNISAYRGTTTTLPLSGMQWSNLHIYRDGTNITRFELYPRHGCLDVVEIHFANDRVSELIRISDAGYTKTYFPTNQDIHFLAELLSTLKFRYPKGIRDPIVN